MSSGILKAARTLMFDHACVGAASSRALGADRFRLGSSHCPPAVACYRSHGGRLARPLFLALPHRQRPADAGRR